MDRSLSLASSHSEKYAIAFHTCEGSLRHVHLSVALREPRAWEPLQLRWNSYFPSNWFYFLCFLSWLWVSLLWSLQLEIKGSSSTPSFMSPPTAGDQVLLSHVLTSALSVPAHQPPAAVSVQLLSIILLLITVSFTPDRELGMQIWWFCTLLLQILLRLSINDYRLKSTLHSMM